jgi:integrase
MRFSKYGYLMLENTIKRWMNSLLKFHTDIKKHMSPHGLRHTHTSLLAEAGVDDLPRIMDRLGHTDDDTTKKAYLHVTKTRKKDASHRFVEHMRSTNL